MQEGGGLMLQRRGMGQLQAFRLHNYARAGKIYEVAQMGSIWVNDKISLKSRNPVILLSQMKYIFL